MEKHALVKYFFYIMPIEKLCDFTTLSQATQNTHKVPVSLSIFVLLRLFMCNTFINCIPFARPTQARVIKP